MKNLIVAMSLLAGLFASTLLAQEETTTIPRLDDAPASAPTTSVFIICCDAKPGQILVLDSAGKWMSTVRAAEVSFTIGQDTPTVKCTMWSGPFRPTNPEVKTWGLAQLKSVTATEFQQMVDSLQTDPEAIRRRLTGAGNTGSSGDGDEEPSDN